MTCIQNSGSACMVVMLVIGGGVRGREGVALLRHADRGTIEHALGSTRMIRIVSHSWGIQNSSVARLSVAV